MSRRHDAQDNTGILERVPQRGTVQAWAATTPTNGAVGYAPSCLWHNVTSPGVLGTILYVNVGSLTSATWLNIA